MERSHVWLCKRKDAKLLCLAVAVQGKGGSSKAIQFCRVCMAPCSCQGATSARAGHRREAPRCTARRLHPSGRPARRHAGQWGRAGRDGRRCPIRRILPSFVVRLDGFQLFFVLLPRHEMNVRNPRGVFAVRQLIHFNGSGVASKVGSALPPIGESHGAGQREGPPQSRKRRWDQL